MYARNRKCANENSNQGIMSKSGGLRNHNYGIIDMVALKTSILMY